MYLFKNISLLGLFIALSAITTVNGQRIINVGLHAGPCLSSINTSFNSSIENVKSEGGLSFNFRLSGKYFFTRQIGVASGFEVLSFKQATTASSAYESFNTYYSENQYYERRIWGDSIEEKVTLIVLHIPLQVFYHHKFNNAVAIYGSFGPGISIPLASNTNGNGRFTYKGYFSEENALLWDIPIYGLSSDVDVNVNNKIKTNPVIINIAASVGVEFSMNRYYRFNATLGYYRTITSAIKTGSSIHLSNEAGSYNSMLGSGENNLSNIWFSIGLSKNILF